jgi:hypothetical protein
METMLIGSTATKRHFTDARKSNDRDYFSRVQINDADCFWDDRLDAWPSKHFIATPDELYTIKISHSAWNLHGTWRKHMNDALYLSRKGAKFLPGLYEILYPIWEDVHGKKRVHLDMTKDEFFADRIVRKYDHDSLHESVAYYDRPIYLRMLKDGETIAVDKSKWDALSFEDKIKCAREEIYANALERRVIPENYRVSPTAAYAWAVQQTITSLSKGWFSLFCALNWDELRLPDVDYVQRHLDNADRLIPLEA